MHKDAWQLTLTRNILPSQQPIMMNANLACHPYHYSCTFTKAADLTVPQYGLPAVKCLIDTEVCVRIATPVLKALSVEHSKKI